MYTSWQIEGFAWSPRDDVMKALQVIATIMNDWGYQEFENGISKLGIGIHLDYKKSSYIFELANSSFGPIQSLSVSKETRATIRMHLLHVLNLVRGLTDINARPPYGEIIAAFLECEQLAESFR